MTKVAAAPIYMVKTFKNFLLQAKKPEDLELGMEHRCHKLYKVYINDDPGFT